MDAAGIPVSFSISRFQVMTMPSRSMANVASGRKSMISARLRRDRTISCSARFRSVMSRIVSMAATTLPSWS
ncbi:MAG: hypothetical protein BWX50_01483 [Euryarchaeota archaeon ADurb.Bin009]|nr:MAG: hypothetical protein BWX50_01483 [Euryarchaeota archaeon ADurb.Bin009]